MELWWVVLDLYLKNNSVVTKMSLKLLKQSHTINSKDLIIGKEFYFKTKKDISLNY